MNVFDVVITGGEPLMHFDGVLVCLEEAVSRGMGVSLNSDLVPLTTDKATKLKKKGLRGVLTSLLGPTAEVHNKIAQRENAFDRTVRGIKILQDEGLGVMVNMVVTKSNKDHIRETAEFVASLGVKKFAATKAGWPGNCADFANISLSKDEFNRYLKDLHEAGIEFGLEVDFLEGYSLCSLGDLDRYGELIGRRCMAGVTTFTIASNGDVRPCSRFDSHYGNLFEDSIGDIWNRMQPWREGAFVPDICKKCTLLAMCGGGCRMEAKMYSGGDVTAMDPRSRPENVPHCLATLKQRQSREVGEKKPTKKWDKNKRFLLNKIRWREESFGAVATVENSKSVAFLSHGGLAILRQLHAGVVYKMDDERLSWGTIDREEFLFTLAEKGVILPADRGVRPYNKG